MGWIHIHPSLRFRIYPPALDALTGKHQPVRSAAIDDGELKIAFERRGLYGLPHF
jgi:hypothetical protein